MLLKHHRVDLVVAFFARRDLLMLQDGSHLQDEVLMPERPMSYVIFGRPAFQRPNGSPFGLVELLQTSFFIEMTLLQEIEDDGLTRLCGHGSTLSYFATVSPQNWSKFDLIYHVAPDRGCVIVDNGSGMGAPTRFRA